MVSKVSLFAIELREPEFRLDPAFVAQFADAEVDWGPVGYVVYKRTYARDLDGGRSEEWYQTVARVVEGVYRIQQRHCAFNHVSWKASKAQRSAQEMYRMIFEMKFLPPGRGLWMMGTPFLEIQGGAALQNCGFVSTERLADDFAEPFCWLMDMSMLGVGVGGDVDGAGTVEIHSPVRSTVPAVIPDSREGWIAAVYRTLAAYATDTTLPSEWDYSQIRPYGSPIKGFGGIAAGPGVLKQLIEVDIPSVLDPLAGGMITSTAIVDIFNFIGKCVVAGNVRRSAEIMLGDPGDIEFLNLKDPDLAQVEMDDRRWASNNSIRATVGMGYSGIAKRIAKSGEPGGLWMDHVRGYSRMVDPRNDKDHRAKGCNPCVPGDTLILTRSGYQRIDSLVGSEVDVWNGMEWSSVRPRITGRRQPIVRVELSDGTSLRCTPSHEWIIDGHGKVRAEDLFPGQRLEKFSMPLVEGGESLPHAYEHGFFCGDGQVAPNGSKGALLYGEKQALFADAGEPDAYGRRWVGLPKSMPEKFVVPHGAAMADRLSWLAGVLDADGTVLQNPGSISLQLSSVNRRFLLEIRRMLTTLGVQAKVTMAREEGTRELPDGHGGVCEYACQTEWRLLINAEDTWRLTSLGLPCRRCSVPTIRPQRDARRFVTVEAVLPDGEAEEVFCFTEDKRHQGTFEGIVTGQCGEQSLEDRELCCLVETFPARCADYDEYERVLKFAYLYAKTVVLLPTHSQRTNEIMARNRRIGTSQSGIIQNFARVGRREHFRWCDSGYKYIQKLDEIYSEWLACRRSIKTTSVKPSGTVSKLCGASSGIHYPPAEWYIQRIRFAIGSPLLDLLTEAGYPSEPCIYAPNTMVVEFPCHEVDFVAGESDVSLWEQIGNAVQMQRWWADNQVSCTVKFDGSDPVKAAKEIQAALELYEDQLKGISFLPHQHRYAQAPWEPCTEEEYLRRMSTLKPLKRLGDRETNEVQDKFCDGDRCLI